MIKKRRAEPLSGLRQGTSKRSRSENNQSCPTFQYRPLDREAGGLRFLRLYPPGPGGQIQCQLHHTNEIRSTPPKRYTALSYVWGPPHPTRPILINGCAFSVRSNLFDFLETYANVEATPQGVDLWIDAICINQADYRERNHHVQAMAEIYTKAEKTVAWLGPSSWESEWLYAFLKNSPRGVDILDTVYRESGTEKSGLPYRTHPLCQAVQFVTFLEYWTRLWIVQEVCLSRTVEFWLGKRSFSAFMLRRLVQCTPALRANGIEHTNISKVLKAACYIRAGSTGTLESAIYNFGEFGCEDKHDVVYALLGMTEVYPRSSAVMEVKYQESLEDLIGRTISFCRPKCALRLAIELMRLMRLTGLGSEQASSLSDRCAAVTMFFRPMGYLLQPPIEALSNSPRRILHEAGSSYLKDEIRHSTEVPCNSVFEIDFSAERGASFVNMAPFTNAISIGEDEIKPLLPGSAGQGTIFRGETEIIDPQDAMTALQRRRNALDRFLEGCQLSLDKHLSIEDETFLKVETKSSVLVQYVLALDDIDHRYSRQDGFFWNLKHSELYVASHAPDTATAVWTNESSKATNIPEVEGYWRIPRLLSSQYDSPDSLEATFAAVKEYWSIELKTYSHGRDIVSNIGLLLGD